MRPGWVYVVAVMRKVGIDDGGDDRVEVDGRIANDVDGGFCTGGDELKMGVASIFEELEERATGRERGHLVLFCVVVVVFKK